MSISIFEILLRHFKQFINGTCQDLLHILSSDINNLWNIYFVPGSESSRQQKLQGSLPGVKVLRSNTHTHPFNGSFSRLPGWAGTSKVKPISTLLKQEAVSGSGISWAICKSASHSRQISTPAPHHSNFLQAGYASCRPTSSVKALKARCSSFRSKKTIIPFVENLKYCRFV